MLVCNTCGGRLAAATHRVLELGHLDPSDKYPPRLRELRAGSEVNAAKTRGLSSMMEFLTFEEAVVEVFQKCEVICVVCHRLLTHGGRGHIADWAEPRELDRLLTTAEGRRLLADAAKMVKLCTYGEEGLDKDHTGAPGRPTGRCLFDGTREGFPLLTGPLGMGTTCAYHRYAKDWDHIDPELKRQMRLRFPRKLGVNYESWRLPLEEYLRDMAGRRVVCAPCHRFHSTDMEVGGESAGGQVFLHLLANLGDPLRDPTVAVDFSAVRYDFRRFVARRLARKRGEII
jgi:hypothetical protein